LWSIWASLDCIVLRNAGGLLGAVLLHCFAMQLFCKVGQLCTAQFLGL